MAVSDFFSFLGLIVAGDIGDQTIWTNKRGVKVWSRKNWPDKPASIRQQAQRSRWQQACANWSQLDDSVKAEWELMSRRAYVPATGFNLFMHESLRANTERVQTLRRQSGVFPPRAEYVPLEVDQGGQFF